MKVRAIFIKLPVKIFWSVIATLSICINLVVYLFNKNISLEATTGYSVSYWERIILVLQEFYSIGV